MRRYRPFLYILMFSAAASGCAEVRSPLASFRPPSGVVAKTSPGLSAYNLRRIGILPFQNESGAPAAGNKLADLFYEAGADGFLAKPLRLKALSRTVHRLLNRPTN